MSTSPKTRWGVILLIVACGMIGAAQIFKFASAMPTIRSELGLGLVAGGWVFSIISLIAMLAGFAAGTLSDLFGHRRTLIIGVFSLGVGSLIGSFAGNGAVMMAARVVEGIGFLAVVVAAPGLIADEATDRNRNFAFSLWGLYHPAGASMTLLLAPLAFETLSWRVVWQAMAALSFGLVAILLFYRPQKPDRAAGEGAAFGRMMQNLKLTLVAPGPRLVALSFGLYTFNFVSLIAWLPSFMIEQRGISAVTAGSLTALVIVANAFGNLVAGMLLHRGVRYFVPILVAATSMAAITLVIFSSALPDDLRYVACLAFGLFGGMVPTTVFAAASALAPSRAQIGAANGMLVQGANTGSVLGPPALAAVAAWTGAWEQARWPMLAALALLVVVALAIRRVELRRTT